jgi:quercetin dioxygenase-like cupin family protein
MLFPGSTRNFAIDTFQAHSVREGGLIMVVLPYDGQPHARRPDGVEMTDFYAVAKGLPGGAGVQMGLGVFPPGMEAPPAAHDADEYAYVLSGAIKAKVGGKVFAAAAGSATFIPAGEEHVSFNDADEECRVVWMLVGAASPVPAAEKQA